VGLLRRAGNKDEGHKPVAGSGSKASVSFGSLSNLAILAFVPQCRCPRPSRVESSEMPGSVYCVCVRGGEGLWLWSWHCTSQI